MKFQEPLEHRTARAGQNAGRDVAKPLSTEWLLVLVYATAGFRGLAMALR